MSFHKRVLRCRQKLELTQQQLADLIGVSRPCINVWEDASREIFPNSSNIKKLSQVFGVDESWLRFGKIEDQPKDYILPNENVVNRPAVPILMLDQIKGWLSSKQHLLNKGVLNMSQLEKDETAFKYPMNDESMIGDDPFSSIFPGEILKADPTQVKTLESGNIVCAQIMGDKDELQTRMLMRCYGENGAQDVLVPLNKDDKKFKKVLVDNNVKIVARVVESIRQK